MKFSKEQLEYLEEVFTLPCCHTSGMHSPTHFQNREYICQSQIKKAFMKGCNELGINPQVKSDPNCGWCKSYPDKKAGEGLRLFQTSDDTGDKNE